MEKQAAAASTILDVGSQDIGSTDGTGPQGEVGAQKMPALPRWDCNDGDTWHKRQRVYSKSLYCIAADCRSSHSVVLWIAGAPLRCCMIDQHTAEQQGAGDKCLVLKAAASSKFLSCTNAMQCNSDSSSCRRALHGPDAVPCHGRTNLAWYAMLCMLCCAYTNTKQHSSDRIYIETYSLTASRCC